MKLYKYLFPVLMFLLLLPIGVYSQCGSDSSQVVVKVTTKTYGNEVFWKIKNTNGITVDSVRANVYRNNRTYYDTLCVAHNEKHTFQAWDLWGDGWSGATYEILINGITLANNGGLSPTDSINRSGVSSIETKELFRVLVDTLPDVALYAVLSPNYLNCGVSSLQVSAQVKVVDSVQVDTLYVKYKFGSGSIVSEKFGYAKALKQDTIVTVTFSKSITTLPYGTNALSVWIDLPLDNAPWNDSLSVPITIDSVKSNFPIKSDFDSLASCGNRTSTCISDGSCPISTVWTNMGYDDIDWSVNSGSTPSSSTGPSTDHTLLNSNGKYLYIEASGCNNKTALLQANCIDISQLSSPFLSFWYNMYGAGIGKLVVEIDTGGTWIVLDSLSGQQQTSDTWGAKLIDLSNYKTVANIRFRGVTTSVFTGDIALDDIEIGNVFSNDLKVSELLGPSNNSCGDSSVQFLAIIENLGQDTIFSASINLEFSHDTLLNKTVSYNDSLGYGETDTIFFGKINLSEGDDFRATMTAYLAKDLNRVNDTAYLDLSIIRSPLLTTVRDTGRCRSGAIELVSNSRIGDTTLWYSDKLGNNVIGNFDTFKIVNATTDTIFYFKTKAVLGNCYSAAAAVSVLIQKGLESNISVQSNGKINSKLFGSITNDSLTENDSVKYKISIPKGLSLSDYGGRWSASISLETSFGHKPSRFQYTASKTEIPELLWIPNTYDADSTFIIKFTVSDLTTGCDSVYSRIAFIRSRPKAMFNSKNICLDDSMQFVNTSSIETGTISYLWNFGDGTSSNLESPKHLYKSYGTYSVKLIVTSNLGMADSVVAAISVYPNPIAKMEFDSVCVYDAVSFSNKSTISSGTLSSLWSFGDGNNSTITSPKYIFGKAGNYNVQLVSKSNNNCTDTVTGSLEIYSPPLAGFSANSVCVYDSTAFIDSSFGANRLFWKFGNGKVSSDKNPKHFYGIKGSYIVEQIVANSKGCRDTAISKIDVFGAPKLGITTSDLCIYDSVRVNVSATSAHSYSWSWGNGDSTNTALNSHKYDSAGVFKINLVVKSAQGCIASDATTVTVNAQPKANYSVENVCLGDTMNFINASSITSGFISSKWSFGDGNTTNSISPSNLYASVGSYNATLITTSTLGCSDTLTKSVTINPNPVANFEIGLLCTNASNLFVNKSTGAGRYKWYFGNGDSSSSSNPSINYTSAASYNVRLVAHSSKNCVSIYDSTVQAYLSPTSLFTVANNCYGDSTSLTNYSSNTNSNIWYFGDGNSVTGIPTSYKYDTSGTYAITLVNTNSKGCTDSSTKTVEIYAPAIAGFNRSNVCFGDSMYFTNRSSNYVNSYWSFGDGLSSSNENPIYLYGKTNRYNVQLVATSSNNCSDTVEHVVVVNPKPTASYSVNNTVCAEVALTFNNSSNSATSYLWTFGDGNSSNQENPKHSYTNPGYYTVVLKAQNDSGCVSHDSSIVQVFAKPQASFTTANVCLNSSSVFSNSSSIKNGSFSSSWDFGDSSGKSNTRNPKYTYSKAGVFSVKLITTSSNSCVDSIIVNDTIYALPIASFITDTVCLTQSTSFSNTSSNGVSYSWSFTPSNSSTDKNPVYKYLTAGEKVVSLEVVSVNNCVTSRSDTVLVNALPSLSYSATNVCFGDTVEIVNTSSNVNSSFWTLGDGKTSSVFVPKYLYGKADSFTMTYYAESAQGCSDSLSQNVVVKPIPIAKFSSSLICAGQVTTLRNTSKGARNYKWYLGNGDSSFAENPLYTYDSSGTYHLRLFSSHSNGCTSVFDSSIVVNVSPVALFNMSNVCQGRVLTLADSSSNVANYNWSFGDGTSSALSLPKKIYSKSGNYYVKLITRTSAGCTDSLVKNLTVFTPAVASFSTNNICLGDTAHFSNKSSNANSVNWSFGDGSSSTQINPQHYYNRASSYNVILIATSSDNCVDTVLQSITIKSIPTVSFSHSNSICAEDTLAVKNSSTGVTSSVWTFGNMQSSNATQPVVVYNSAGNFWLKLSATSGSNCTVSDSSLITVYHKPEAIFNANGVCNGSSMSFTNASNLTSGKLNYVWDFGDSKGTSVLKNPTYLYSSAGKYDIKLIATSANGCKDSVLQTDTVFQLPQLDFSHDTVCLGDSTSLTNNSSNAVKSEWEYGSTSVSTTQSKFKLPFAGTHVFSLQGTSSMGCTTKISKNVLVHALPTALFTTSNVCQSDSAIMNNYSKGALTFAWNLGDGSSSIASSVTHKYQKGGTFQVQLIAQSSVGCLDTIITNLTVFDNPVASFSATNNCLGDTTIFTNSTTGASSYYFSFGDGNTSTNINPKNVYGKSGTYQITLNATSAKGCLDTSQRNVFVYSLPSAGFSAGNVCLGDSVHYANFSTGASTNTWRFGDGNSSSSAQPNHLFSVANNYVTTLITSTSNGCIDSVRQAVVVYALPTAFFTSQDTLCLGDTTTFIDMSLNADDVHWRFDDKVLRGKGSFKYVFRNDTNYNVWQHVETLNGCTDSDSKLVVINGLPNAQFSVFNVCYGDSTYVVNNSSNAINYDWDFNDGSISALETPKHLFNQKGEQRVLLTATHANGCIDTVSQKLMVADKPNVDFTANISCEKSETVFANLTSQQIGETTYEWDFGDGNTSVKEHASHKFSISDTFDVMLKAQSSWACVDSLSKQLIVNAKPTVLFDHSLACEGDSFKFYNKSTIASGGITQSWMFGADTLFGDTVAYFLSEAGSYSLQIVALSDIGCKKELNTVFEVGEKPKARFISDRQDCQNSEVEFLDFSDFDGQGNLKIIWSYGDSSAIDTLQDANHIFKKDGVFLVKQYALSPSGCIDSMQRSLTIHPDPKISINWEEVGAKVYFTPGDTSLSNYRWDFGDGNLSRFTNAVNEYEKDGNYYISLLGETDKGCRKEINKIINLTKTGVNHNLVSPFKFYPNPFTESIKYENNAEKSAEVVIYNQLGQVVEQLTLETKGVIQTQMFPAGTYYLTITLNKASTVHKFVKLK